MPCRPSTCSRTKSPGAWGCPPFLFTLRVNTLQTIYLLAGVVRAAHQRAGLHVREAQRQRLVAQRRELCRGHVALDRQVLRRGLEVLAEGEDVAAHGAQVGEHLD